ncbi:MAG: hypothetical protein ACRDP6_39040 [Actinoallomurus sp.]
MTLLAATDTATSSSAGPVLVFALVLGIGYATACLIWPFRACRHCHGTGRFLSPTGRAWRHCTHCAGTGAKLRLGRRAINYLRQTHDRDHTTRKPR